MKLLKKIGLVSIGLLSSSLAMAQAAPAGSTQRGLISMLPMLLIFVAVFYFLIIRPQSKRAKEQKQLMDSMQLGDEVLTNGGIVGKIVKLRDSYITVLIAKETEVMLQKNAVATILPKGTLEQ